MPPKHTGIALLLALLLALAGAFVAPRRADPAGARELVRLEPPGRDARLPAAASPDAPAPCGIS